MTGKLLLVAWFGVSALMAGEVPAVGKASNEKVAVEAKLYLKHDDVVKVLGQDPGPGIVVVDVTVKPAEGLKRNVTLSEFVLSSDKDGQRSEPFYPSQIAGSSTLVVSETGGAYAGTQDNGRPWGGIPGAPGGIGRLPGTGSGMGTSAGPTGVGAKVEKGSAESDEKNPVLAALKQKMLAEGETSGPLSGLLYFPLEGKHKVKQIELFYGTRKEGLLRVHFEE